MQCKWYILVKRKSLHGQMWDVSLDSWDYKKFFRPNSIVLMSKSQKYFYMSIFHIFRPYAKNCRYLRILPGGTFPPKLFLIRKGYWRRNNPRLAVLQCVLQDEDIFAQFRVAKIYWDNNRFNLYKTILKYIYISSLHQGHYQYGIDCKKKLQSGLLFTYFAGLCARLLRSNHFRGNVCMR